MRGVLSVLLVSWLPLASAQTPAPGQPPSEPQLSPQAAYDRATRPLEITRRSPQNWSDVELAALKVARENAKTECAARNPDQLNGEDLLALAHLCAFAFEWQAVHQAASNYINAAQGATSAGNSQGSTELATAFDYKVQASLNLNDPEDAVHTVQTMLRTAPYDLFASEATNSTIEFIRFIRTDESLVLLAQRQPILLARIKTQASPAQGSNGAAVAALPNTHPPLPLYALYADAMALPSTQQFANQSQAADESYAELESALPGSLSSEDAMYIGEKRRQYLLLGTHLPTLDPMGFLAFPGAAAPDKLNTWFANATVFLLFPDWCNQCVVMGSNATSKTKELADAYHVRFYPLIAQAHPLEKQVESPAKNVPLSTKPGKAAQGKSERLHVDQQLAMKSSPDALLEGTPTIVVPDETIDKFAATDFPLIVAADHNGIIRFIHRASDDTLAPGGDIDRIVQHIISTWRPE
jgi:hypothetical protein